MADYRVYWICLQSLIYISLPMCPLYLMFPSLKTLRVVIPVDKIRFLACHNLLSVSGKPFFLLNMNALTEGPVLGFPLWMLAVFGRVDAQ